MAPTRIDEDKDPVIAEYEVFITPSPSEDVYLLQYPVRRRAIPYNRHHGASPLEMRLKPKSGFVEVDVAQDTTQNFNKFSGLQWGSAMHQAKDSGLTTFGATAGFGPGNIKVEPRRARFDQFEGPDMYNYDEALQDDKVLQKQTLGGQVHQVEPGKPQYMLGAFRGGELHLTKLDGIAQLRPAFHHIDAAAHVERAAAQREPDETRPPQARGYTQSYKPNRDDAPRPGLDKSLMQLAVEEKWTRMNYFDQEDEESKGSLRHLFVEDAAAAEQLHSSMTNEMYLEGISAPRHDPSGRRKKKPLTRKQRQAIEVGDGDADRPGEVIPEPR